ncbi:MAG: hypothetical protein JNL18_00725 [Planctomycetaceae bacterium]|nr:hypothetical protein [Planctomycetaceae bacterium]
MSNFQSLWMTDRDRSTAKHTATGGPLDKRLGNCPQCDGSLEEGIVAIHGTWWSGLFVGWSYENLWFRPHGGQETAALQSGESRRGWRCAACGFVGVAAPGRDAGLPGYKYSGGRG